MSALTIRPQTAEEAFRYTIGRIQKKDFYNQHGYCVDLPEHPAFQEVWDNPNFLTDEKK